MGVDVHLLVRGETGLFGCQADGLGGVASLGMGGGVVVSVAGVAIAANLGINLGTPFTGALFAFENQDAGTFAHHEAFAAGVEGDRSRQRVLVLCEGLHVVETGQGNVADGALGTAANHGVGTSFAYQAVSLAHGMGAGGASRHDGQVGALAVVLDGHVARPDVGNHHGDEVRRHAARAFLQQFGMLGVEGLDATDTRTDGAAYAHGLHVLANLQTAVCHGLMGGSQGKEGVHVVAAGGASVDIVVFGIEVFHFTGHMDGQCVAVGSGDGGDAAAACYQPFP